MLYLCDLCGDEVETCYVDLQTGLYLCSECYFADDIDNDDDDDEE
jgi:hypothetical protein